MMHMFCYLALYSLKYSDLNDVPIACIVSRRNFIVLLQRASFKDMDQARLVAEHVATIQEQIMFYYFSLQYVRSISDKRHHHTTVPVHH